MGKNKKLIIIVLIILAVAILSAVLFLIFGGKIIKKKISTMPPAFEKSESEEIMPLKEVVFNTDKQTYGPEETIKAVAIVYNPFFKAKKWSINYYFISEDERYSDIGQTEEKEIKPGQTAKIEFSTLVGKNLLEGAYKVKLEILEQGQVVNSKTVYLEIKGTNKELAAEVKICQDSGCSMEKTVFLAGETVYIKIESEIADLQISGKIKYPEKEEWREAQFKNNFLAIKADQTGSYSALINIGKEGYGGLSANKEFSVESSFPKIINASKCKADGKCAGEENAQNCPQDCL